jgi:osmotically-inducible protein OsmY
MGRRGTGAAALVLATLSLALVGCDQRQRDQAANQADRTLAQADQRAREMGDDARQRMDRASEQMTAAARDAQEKTMEAGEKAADKVEDAVITTTVKSELARDSTLSATRINVDTDAGRVLLRGSAPSEQARDHATALVSGVRGVVSVDNQLTVGDANR